MQRLPAIPIVTFDPYFSVWMPADTLTDCDTAHWCGQALPIRGGIEVDACHYRFLGAGEEETAQLKDLQVTPLTTRAFYEVGGTAFSISFTVPFLPKELDRASMPVCLVRMEVGSLDGRTHDVKLRLALSDRLCYNAEDKPEIAVYPMLYEDCNLLEIGQITQKILSQSADSITIDWGYLCLGGKEGRLSYDGDALKAEYELSVSGTPVVQHLLIAYEDIASILYFGQPCRAWYARNGMTMVDAMRNTQRDFDGILQRCDAFDRELTEKARSIGGEDYVKLVNASWRHVFAAHKLIATPEGEMAFISKENNSNGCAGTVDVSYPSTPMFLAYCPELVNAMCRPVIRFARTDVWAKYDFAPHDVGRYPLVTGQVYGNDGSMDIGRRPGYQPPFYLMPADPPRYRFERQMPVEESGNMIIMLYAAMHYGSDMTLARESLDLCEKWVKYLMNYGEDPGEQLCTDDFAGHLAHNINLSAKAMVGVACYGRLLNRLGRDGESYLLKARQMAASWLKRASGEEGTYLTFDGKGWSMKYNLAWDRALGLGLLPPSFYEKETRSYLAHINEFGLPLDSRADYTKSDWELWCAAMAEDRAVREKLISGVVRYLEQTPSRVPFSDWYDTKTSRYVQFKARSVQGGLYMPFLCQQN